MPVAFEYRQGLYFVATLTDLASPLSVPKGLLDF